MSNSGLPKEGIFHDEIIVPESAIDINGHVNNVVFVQWMQDVATRHFNAVVSAAVLKAAAAIWVARSHQVEYLSPAFAGERIQILTWVANFSRVRSLRRYKFVRASDGKLLVQGETDWVLVNAQTGRPCSIPEEVKNAFILIPEGMEP